MIETLAHGYSSESAQRELSNEYHGFQKKSLSYSALEESSLSIGRVNPFIPGDLLD